MALNMKCPRCGGTRVQLSGESNKHGCLFTILFGIWYLMWFFVRMMIGLVIFLCYDWWMAIVHVVRGKGHVWQGTRWFSNRRRIYYCHDCGYNFRG